MSNPKVINIIHNPEKNRFEASLDEGTAEHVYIKLQFQETLQ